MEKNGTNFLQPLKLLIMPCLFFLQLDFCNIRLEIFIYHVLDQVTSGSKQFIEHTLLSSAG